MTESIDKVFADCLEMIESKQHTLAEFLDAYPQFERELHALFSVVSSLSVLNGTMPSIEFSQTSPKRLLGKLPDRKVPWYERIYTSIFGSKLQLKPKIGFAQLMIGVVVLLMVLTSGMFAVNAASPGNLLYGLDRKFEQVRLSIAVTPEKTIALHLKHADERLDEAKRKLADDDLNQALVAFEAYRNEIYQAAKIIAGLSSTERDAILAQFYEHLAVQRQEIAEIEQQVPEQARNALKNSLNPVTPAESPVSPQIPADCAPQNPMETDSQNSAGETQQGNEENVPQNDGCGGGGSNENESPGPSEENFQNSIEEPAYGPTDQVPPGPGKNKLPNLDSGTFQKKHDA